MPEFTNSHNFVGGGVSGNAFFTTININPKEEIDKLSEKIKDYLLLPDITDEQRKELSQLAEQALAQSVNDKKHSEISTKFGKVVEEIKKLKVLKEVIWLDRTNPKDEYDCHVLNFKQDCLTVPYIFAVFGLEEDKTDYTSEMLVQFQVNKNFEQKTPQNIITIPLYKSISITERLARNQIYRIIRDFLKKDIDSKKIDELQQLLNEELADRIKIARYPVIQWNEKGIFEFIKLWMENINKNHSETPLILFLDFSVAYDSDDKYEDYEKNRKEFKDKEYEKLYEIFSKLNNTYGSVNILPKLEMVQKNDIRNFYREEFKIDNITRKRSDVYDENALTPAHAPIYFADAIKLMKLK